MTDDRQALPEPDGTLANDGRISSQAAFTAVQLQAYGDARAQAARMEAMAECVALYGHEDVLAPVGNSAWGEAYQDGWIAGAQAYRDQISALGGKGATHAK